MYSSFGYFSDPSDDFSVIKNMFYSLKHSGKVLIDVRGKEIHAMENTTNASYEMPNGDLIFQRSKVNEDWTRSDTDWIYISGEKAYKFQMSVNLYSGAELRSLLQKAGFSKVKIYGDLKGADYNHNAKRLVVVAEKV